VFTFVHLAGARAEPVSRAAALTDHDNVLRANANSDPGYVRTRMLALVAAPPDAFGEDRFTIPPVKAEDSVGFGNDVPALDVTRQE
jgi:hypothetical protein